MPLQLWHAYINTMKDQRSLIQQPFERSDILNDDRFREASQFCLFLGIEVLAGIDDDRDVADLGLDLLHQLESVHFGKCEVQNDTLLPLRSKLEQCSFGDDDPD